MPKCSNNIFNPINTKIIPPNNCAFFSYLVPNLLPTFEPIKDIINVIIPIDNTAITIFTLETLSNTNLTWFT